MTYYLVNNHVGQDYPEDPTPKPRHQYYLVRPPPKHSQDFVPSVQYDPKDVDTDHFTPIEYGAKISHDHYPINYSKQKIQYPRPSHFYDEDFSKDYPLHYEHLAKVPDDYELTSQSFESLRYRRPYTVKPSRVGKSRANDPHRLDHISKSLRLANRLPESLDKDNLDSSLKTLVEILDILHGKGKARAYAKGDKAPRVITESRYEATQQSPVEERFEEKGKAVFEYYRPMVQDVVYEAEQALEEDKMPEEIAATTEAPTTTTTERSMPLSVPAALKYGATRGKPHVDYPAYAAIPETRFNCKEQRYKGFFGDPETGCQV